MLDDYKPLYFYVTNLLMVVYMSHWYVSLHLWCESKLYMKLRTYEETYP